MVSYATFIRPVLPPVPAAVPAVFDPKPLVTIKDRSTEAETTAALTKFFYEVSGFGPSMTNEQLQTYVGNYYADKRRLLQAAATTTSAASSTTSSTTNSTTATASSTTVTVASDAKTLRQAFLYYAND